jgi:DNA-directed RNA polymerase subunit L
MSKNNINIKVRQVSKQKFSGIERSELVVELNGSDMNTVIGNTFRRVCFDDVPGYAFPKELIQIEGNTSRAFDNDQMKLRLSQLPILNVKQDLFFLHPKYWKNVNLSDPKREKHPEEKIIEAYVNIHNNSAEIMRVTTKNMKVYVDGKESDMYSEIEPILLIELKPNQTFKCAMKGALGVPENNAIWMPIANAFANYIDQDDDVLKDKSLKNSVHSLSGNNCLLTIQSSGQTDEYEILIKACQLINSKLESIKDEISNQVKLKKLTPSNVMIFELENEDHTICNLIDNKLKEHIDVIYSGYNVPDLQVKLGIIKVMFSEKIKSPLDPLFETIEYLQNLFKHLEKEFTKTYEGESEKKDRKSSKSK